MARRFVLERLEDPSGVSGIGTVAEGTEYACGKCTVCFIPDPNSVGVHNTIAEVIRVHGHGGNTVIVWID